MLMTCNYCGKQYEGRPNSHFCSSTCKNSFHSQERRDKVQESKINSLGEYMEGVEGTDTENSFGSAENSSKPTNMLGVLNALKNTIGRIETKVDVSNARLVKADPTQLGELEQENQDLTEQLGELEQTNEELTEENEELQDKNNDLQSEVERLRTYNNALNNENKRLSDVVEKQATDNSNLLNVLNDYTKMQSEDEESDTEDDTESEDHATEPTADPYSYTENESEDEDNGPNLANWIIGGVIALLVLKKLG